MADNRIVTRPELGGDVADPFKSYHDVAATQASIQKLLSGGTPDWVRFPQDYKNYAREAMAAEKEISDEMAEQYHMESQDDLTNRAARMVNSMATRDFISKLRANGVKCFTVYNGLPQTVGLWCIPPKVLSRARYICYLQVPAMYEWSVLKLDRHNIPAGESFRGWRTVIVQLIEKEILTEEEANKIFGPPSNNPVFSRYHRSLWEVRNSRRYTEDELAAKDV